MTAQRNKVKNVFGFTLIELMVAISIIAILATVGLVVYSTAQKSSRISKRLQDLQAIRTSIELFKTATGFYPSVTTAGTFVCLESLTGNNSLVPNYMPQIPKDPIQSGATNCYQYTSDGTGASAAGTIYKAKTNVPSTEMAFTDINTQLSYIDPDKDTVADDNCVVTALTANVAGQAWAVYTATNTACNW